MLKVLEKDKQLKNHKFIDLFAGIGGFHYALNSFRAKCVFASEIDENASEVYFQNHNLKPFGDITKIDASEIPSHDILCAGFPCQAFSISGKQKGFEDSRGTLFFDVARITKYHKPKILLLENVKNFAKHNKGNTLKIVVKILEELNYKVFYDVLNTSNFGLPQNRERIFIVAFNKSFINKPIFNFPSAQIASKLEDILEENPLNGKIIQREDVFFYKDFKISQDLFGIFELPNKPIQIGKINKGGQGERIYHPKGHSVTLSASGGGVGSKTGLYKIGDKIRKLSPRECARLQGFPESFKLPKSVTQAQKQFGNSISINTVQFIIQEILKTMERNGRQTMVRFPNSKNGFQERKRYCKKVQQLENR